MSGVFSVTMFRERGCPPCAVKAAVPIMKRRGFRGHAFPVLLSYEHPANGGVFLAEMEGFDYNMEHPASSRRMTSVHRTDEFITVQTPPIRNAIPPKGYGILGGDGGI